MNGAEALLRAAAECGIAICFANAGTTEIPLVAALDRVSAIRPVLGLFEGVCTGAADGYGRVTGAPAMTLLHLGPGFANGIANLHNARRSRTPVVNLVGEHATWHIKNDPPLAMDIATLAAPVSAWQRTSASTGEVGRDMVEAVQAALKGGISTLIVPNDLQLAEAPPFAPGRAAAAFDPVPAGPVEKAARLLKGGAKAAMILGGRALREAGLREAGRVKAAVGCDLLTDCFPPFVDRGPDVPVVRRIPYFPEAALELLSGYGVVVLAGAAEPVTFFGYPGLPGRLIDERQEKVSIWSGGQDEVAALRSLADALDAPACPPGRSEGGAPAGSSAGGGTALPTGPLDPEKACFILSAMQPENAIIVDEGLTSAFSYVGLSATAPRHSTMSIVGGAIGYGMPSALGAALASPERKVINLQADGCALYTVQALWTEAREGVDVTTLICANGRYRIVEMELSRLDAGEPGPAGRALTRLSPPDVGWVSIAKGFGVPAVSVDTAEGLAAELGRALATPGPHLIEMLL